MTPIELIKQCILKHSSEGEIVFDGFMGSWTTALAAKETNRDFIGFELSSDYCEIGRKRLSQTTLYEKKLPLEGEK